MIKWSFAVLLASVFAGLIGIASWRFAGIFLPVAFWAVLCLISHISLFLLLADLLTNGRKKHNTADTSQAQL